MDLDYTPLFIVFVSDSEAFTLRLAESWTEQTLERLGNDTIIIEKTIQPLLFYTLFDTKSDTLNASEQIFNFKKSRFFLRFKTVSVLKH